MSRIAEVADKIYLIDNGIYSIPEWGSTYLINEDIKVLIDAGSAHSVPHILEALKELGLGPEQIDYLVLTHAHLDHSAGAGTLLRRMPEARLIVHDKGARHVAAPEKLIKGMVMSFGPEIMVKLGEVVPVPEERIIRVSGGESFRLSAAQTLNIIDAPGHAPHAICIFETRNRGIFAGDSAGVYIAEPEVILPSTVPPAFDLEQYVNTLDILMKLEPSRLYFGHFGAGKNPKALIRSELDKLKQCEDTVARAIKRGRFEDAAEEIRASRLAEIEPLKSKPVLYKHVAETGVNLSISGFMNYYRSRQSG